MTSLESDVYLPVENIWQFTDRATVGVAHVKLMKNRAAPHIVDGRVPMSMVDDIIGDPELAQRFMECGAGEQLIPQTQLVDSD